MYCEPAWTTSKIRSPENKEQTNSKEKKEERRRSQEGGASEHRVGALSTQ